MSTDVHSKTAAETPKLDMKLEVVVIPVSDVDRAKRFYDGLGWRLDADFASDDGYFRVIQFTPPGSGSSIIFGRTSPPRRPAPSRACILLSPTSRPPARNCSTVARRSATCSTARPVHMLARTSLTCSAVSASWVQIPSAEATERSLRSAIRTATGGCSRRSPRDCPDAWRPTRPSPRQPISRRRCGAPRSRTASMRSASANGMRVGPPGTPRTSSASRPANSRRRDCGMRRRPGVKDNRRGMTETTLLGVRIPPAPFMVRSSMSGSAQASLLIPLLRALRRRGPTALRACRL
jgi:hypothetical protein